MAGITVELNVKDRGTPVAKKFGGVLQEVFHRVSGRATSATTMLTSRITTLSSRMGTTAVSALKRLATQLTTTTKAQEQLDRGAKGRFLPRLPGLLDRITRGLRRLIPNFRRASSESRGLGKSVSGSLLPLKSFAAILATVGLVALTTKAVTAAQTMEGLELAFRAAAGSAEAGAKEFEFVRQQSERLGLELVGTAASYKGLLAATIASGKEASTARVIFKGVAEAARAMGLSNEDARGTFLAITQIMSKGKVTAEELRLQLGERFPVAVGIMAEAMGVTTKELDKMLEQGQLTADALVPFAEKLSEKYGSDLADAMASSRAAMNRLRNDATELADRVGKGGLLQGVTLVTNGLRDLFQQMLGTNAPEQLGQAFLKLSKEFVALAKEYGPGVLKAIMTVVDFISKNMRPAFQAAGTTVRQVWAGINAGIQQAVKIYADSIKKIVSALQGLVEMAADAADTLGFDGLADKLRETSRGYDPLIERMEELSKKAEEGRDKWLDMLRDANEETKQAATATGLTAAEVRNLGENATVAGGEVLDAGRKMVKGLELPQAPAKKTTGAITALGKAYSQLKQKPLSDLQDAARKSVASFEAIQASGTETKERLIDLFTPVAKEIIGAFGKVPPEMKGLFAAMKFQTGVDFEDIAIQGKSTANSLSSSFEGAAQNIARSMENAAEQAVESMNRMERRSKEIDDIVKASRESSDRLVEALSGYRAFADDLPGLENQLASAIQERANLWQMGFDLDGQRVLWAEYTEIIAELRKRIQDLGEEARDTTASINEDGTGPLVVQQPVAISLTPTVASPITTTGSPQGPHAQELTPAVQGPRIGGGTPGSAFVDDNDYGPKDTPKFYDDSGDSLVLGDDYDRVLRDEDELLRQLFEDYDEPPSGIRIPPGTAGRRQAGDGSGDRTVIFEGLTIEINQKGIDPQAIDARGTARALVPELKELMRRGEFDDLT